VELWLLLLTDAPLKGQCFTARPASSIYFQRQAGALDATVRLCISYHYSVILTDKHNNTDLIYRFYIQHCYIFRLSTSPIVRLEMVHTNNKQLAVSPNKQWPKLVIMTNIIPHKRSNYMKECIRNFRYNPL
jgi:hypothetical protein